MLLATAYQWQVALFMLFGGLLLGFLYDLFRAIRRLFRTGKVLTILLDILYCLLALLLAFFFLWRGADMALRPWMFMGLGLGAGLYFAGPSVFLMGAWMALLRVLRRATARIGKTRLMRWLAR